MLISGLKQLQHHRCLQHLCTSALISLSIHRNGKNTFVGVGKESNLASVE
uniref:Uncharacterized protein n=1 Tax=Serratia marcescens TaxID=615 RepID=A0A345IPS0_SERMA|nr:hypothetical protein [Serratia marcescens]